MKAHGLLVKCSGKPEKIEFSGKTVTLKEMQDCVKGYIEFIRLPNNTIMVVNEEGKINGLGLNTSATTFLQSNNLPHIIVGDVLIIDAKFVD
jgi:hypothetical protein